MIQSLYTLGMFYQKEKKVTGQWKHNISLLAFISIKSVNLNSLSPGIKENVGKNVNLKRNSPVREMDFFMNNGL